MPAYRYQKFILITKKDLEQSQYDTGNFVDFCKELEIFPAVDKLYVFRRVTPPHSPNLKRIDTQIYMYFMENNEEDHIELNKDELTESELMTPRKVFEDYYNGSKQLFFPQIFILMWISQLSEYTKLKSLAIENLNNMIISHLEFRGNPFVNDNEDAKDEKHNSKKYKYLLNENDFLSDRTRKLYHGLIVLNEVAKIDDLADLNPVTEDLNNSGNELFEYHDANTCLVFPGDFFHPNEIYPWRTMMHSRNRAYINGGVVKRYEVTRDVYERFTRLDIYQNEIPQSARI